LIIKNKISQIMLIKMEEGQHLREKERKNAKKKIHRKRQEGPGRKEEAVMRLRGKCQRWLLYGRPGLLQVTCWKQGPYLLPSVFEKILGQTA